jgi:hypothetical protein
LPWVPAGTDNPLYRKEKILRMLIPVNRVLDEKSLTFLKKSVKVA